MILAHGAATLADDLSWRKGLIASPTNFVTLALFPLSLDKLLRLLYTASPMQELNLDLSNPSPADVAKRVIVLKHVVVYALITPPRDMLTKMSAGWSADERLGFRRTSEQRRDEFWGRLRQLELLDALSDKERDFAQSTMLTMTAQQQNDASWRVEAFQVLLWALGYLPNLPLFHQPCDQQILKDFPPADLPKFIETASLRSDDALERVRQQAELWHWRSRTRELIESHEPLLIDNEMAKAGIKTYDDIIRLSAEGAFEGGDLPELVDGDFPVDGQAFRSLSPQQWAGMRSIIVERHFAANWLCGLAPSNNWDLTPTDT